MSKDQKLFLEYSHLTRSHPDDIQRSLHEENNPYKINFLKTVNNGELFVFPAAGENVSLLGAPENGLSPKEYQVIGKLFEVSREELIAMNVFNKDTLKEFSLFVQDAEKETPYAVKAMKENGFSVWKKCQEDLFRARQLQKHGLGEFSDLIIK